MKKELLLSLGLGILTVTAETHDGWRWLLAVGVLIVVQVYLHPVPGVTP